MIRALAPFNIEMLEQPTNSDSLAALSQVRSASVIPIAPTSWYSRLKMYTKSAASRQQT